MCHTGTLKTDSTLIFLLLINEHESSFWAILAANDEAKCAIMMIKTKMRRLTLNEL